MNDQIECYAWSDSTITLAWIRNRATKLQKFIANRVCEIQQADLKWRHVPTHLNPADCASRGLTPSELLQHKLWWNGPSFLYESIDKWPEDSTCLIEHGEVQVFSIITEKIQLWPLQNYSSFTMLQRIVAYCLHFVDNCRSKTRNTSPLTVSELKSAHNSIIRKGCTNGGVSRRNGIASKQ